MIKMRGAFNEVYKNFKYNFDNFAVSSFLTLDFDKCGEVMHKYVI